MISRRFIHHCILGLVIVIGLAQAANAGDPSVPFRLARWPPGAPVPAFDLLDANGRERKPSDYNGAPFAVLFGFTRCANVCPAELLKLSLAIRQAGVPAKKIRVLFITLDPTHDTRSRLKAFVSAFNPRFEALSGSQEQIGAAADSFHVNYAYSADGGSQSVSHGSAVFIFDAHARLALVGSNTSTIEDYSNDLRLLAAEKP